MNNRIKKFNLDINEAKNWNLVLKTEFKKIIYSFKEEKIISETVNNKQKIITITLKENLLSALLHRKMHWNNAMIGFHLSSIRRIPNEYCQAVYKALNFLHL